MSGSGSVFPGGDAYQHLVVATLTKIFGVTDSSDPGWVTIGELLDAARSSAVGLVNAESAARAAADSTLSDRITALAGTANGGIQAQITAILAELHADEALQAASGRLKDWSATASQPGLGVAHGIMGIIGLPHAPLFTALLPGWGGVALAPAAAATTISVTLLRGGAQLPLATFSWAVGATVPTVAAASPLPVPADGEALLIQQPATPDTTLADFSVWLLGSKV